MFAALASLASISILVHSVFIDPWVWGGMRIVTGFCYAGLYIVAELAQRHERQCQSREAAVDLHGGADGRGGGRSIPAGYIRPQRREPVHADCSAGLSCGPSALSVGLTDTGLLCAGGHAGFQELFRLSPLGSGGMVLSGVANGALFGFGAVYAQRAGFTVTEISTFMAAMFLGGMVLQWPIGRMSDRMDRRLVIMAVTTAATIVAVGASLIPEPAPLNVQPGGGEDRMIWPILAAAALFGGLSIPHYSLFTAHVNDRVPIKKMVAASSALVFLNGVGAIMGPNLAAFLMGHFGPSGFFLTLAGVHGAIGLMTGLRMLRAAPKPVDQGDFVAMPLRRRSASQMQGWGPDDVEESNRR